MKRAIGVRIFALQETTCGTTQRFDRSGITPIGENFICDPYSLIFAGKSNSPALRLGLLHQTTDRVKHHLELPIVLVLQRHEFVRQILVRSDCLSQTNKRPHDLDVYLNGGFT